MAWKNSQCKVTDVPFNILIVVAYAVGRAFWAARDDTSGVEYHTHDDMLSRVEASFPRRGQIDVHQSGRVLEGKLSSLNLGRSRPDILEIAVENGFEGLQIISVSSIYQELRIYICRHDKL